MGTCHNCNTQITLGNERTNCDNCGELLFYHCNSCFEKFEIKDKETKKKLKECKLCGYFNCPNCGICSWNCIRYEWEKRILRILRPEVTQGNCPMILDKVRMIVSYIEGEKISLDRKTCPEREIPITYAKNKIKGLLVRIEGFKVKDEADREAFLKRLDETTEKELGTELTINNSKEKGSYGQEYRDAFNLLVCLGKLEIQKRKFKKEDKEIEYDVYVRCEKGACNYLVKEDLIINECPNYKKRYNKEAIYCSSCKPYSKGKQKGEQRKLKRRPTDKDSCQLYRGSFNKSGDGKIRPRMGKA